MCCGWPRIGPAIPQFPEQQAVRQSPVSRAKHLLRLAAEATFRFARSWSVAEHGRAIYEAFSVCYEACRASNPTFFNLHLPLRFLRSGRLFVGGPGALGPTQAMIAGTTVAAVSVGLLGFGIWEEWFLSGLCIAAAFVVLAARQSAAARGALLHGAR